MATPINLSTMNNPALLKKLDDAVPLGRMAKPEEIGSVVAFLAGDGASYITATTIFRRWRNYAKQPWPVGRFLKLATGGCVSEHWHLNKELNAIRVHSFSLR